MNALPCFPAIWTKGNNFCDVLFCFPGQDSYSKMGQLQPVVLDTFYDLGLYLFTKLLKIMTSKLITEELQWLEHWWLINHGYFELVFKSLTKNPIAADIIIFGKISGDFLFILIMVCCVYSLESPQWGDSNENTQRTIILQKIEKIPVSCLLPWRND